MNAWFYRASLSLSFSFFHTRPGDCRWERLWNDLFCVLWDEKPLTQSIQVRRDWKFAEIWWMGVHHSIHVCACRSITVASVGRCVAMRAPANVGILSISRQSRCVSVWPAMKNSSLQMLQRLKVLSWFFACSVIVPFGIYKHSRCFWSVLVVLTVIVTVMIYVFLSKLHWHFYFQSYNNNTFISMPP